MGALLGRVALIKDEEYARVGGIIEDVGRDMRVGAMVLKRQGCTARGGVREGDTKPRNNNQHQKRAT